MTSLSPELRQIALTAAVEAGEIILTYYNDTTPKTTLKADASPVTSADLHANRVIMDALSKSGIPIISEENKAIPYIERKNWTSYWLVDPLDGTKEFLKKNNEFTVNIAYCEGNEPRYGIIGVPAKGLVYVGDVEKQETYRFKVAAKSSNTGLSQEATSLERASPPGRGLKMAVSRSHLDGQTEKLAADIEKAGKPIMLKKAGSALKFCLLAEGKADLYARFSPTMEWDSAAGQALCKALGYQFVQTDLLTSFSYNKPALKNPGFVVAHPETINWLKANTTV